MTVLEQMQQFSQRYGKGISAGGTTWRYYRIGSGSPVLWLTGGLRRAGLGFDFLQRLSARHTVIAPDYPPVMTIDAFLTAFDAILQAEGLKRVALGGQSYGGLLAQAYLAHEPGAVERLVLSSSGPADYGRAWLLADYLGIALVRILPEQTVKNMLLGGLMKVITLPEAERVEWTEAIQTVLQDDLTRLDAVSHFRVAADLIRKRLVTPSAFRDWKGPVCVLSAANDPTQSEGDFVRYARLFGRPVQRIDMGTMGHTAALYDPQRYIDLLETALR